MKRCCSNVRTITINDEEYPRQLAGLCLPPQVLVTRGPRIPTTARLLTITGSRSPSFLARQAAYDFAAASARAGTHLVVSCNIGVDRHALYGAWEGRRETLVLFDTPLPRYGWHIPSAILITPFIDDVLDVHSRRASCAALCGSLGEATLVIEAATSSSSIAIASAALDGGKEVFVHTVGLARARESGGSRLLAEMGAPLVSSYEELACHLGWDGPPVV